MTMDIKQEIVQSLTLLGFVESVGIPTTLQRIALRVRGAVVGVG